MANQTNHRGNEALVCIESILIVSNKVQHIGYHNDRANTTRRILYGSTSSIDLRKYIDTKGLDLAIKYKCRISYNNEVIKVDITPYPTRVINKVKLVSTYQLRYDHKYESRPELDDYYAQRGDCDEIIMVNEAGYLTDAYYFNIVLRKGDDYFTPAHNLLSGTMRNYLLQKRIIKAKSISVSDIQHYDMLYLVNAMNPLGTIMVDICNIIH